MRLNALGDVGLYSVVEVALYLGEYPLATWPVDMEIGIYIDEISGDHRRVKHLNSPGASP